MQTAETGAWRRRVLLISDKGNSHLALSERLAKGLRNTGLQAEKLFPLAGDSNEQHQSRLRQAFDQGQLLVHFYGHGGRYMWQTASGSYADLSNLFDLDDLDLLKPTTRWPVVVSMTCSTGPFDHPSADSLGEKFLRLPDRGAVAVLAASARNSPSVHFSDVLMSELARPGFLGEAIATAKNAVRPDYPAALYNLFGDPALTLALPP
jgi:hypothetical protein